MSRCYSDAHFQTNHGFLISKKTKWYQVAMMTVATINHMIELNKYYNTTLIISSHIPSHLMQNSSLSHYNKVHLMCRNSFISGYLCITQVIIQLAI